MFKRAFQLFLILALMVLLGGAVNAVITYGEWQDQSQVIEIDDGDSVDFSFYVFTMNGPLDISIKLYDDTSHLVYTYKNEHVGSTSLGGSYTVEKSHYVNPGDYSIVIYSTDGRGDGSTNALSLKVNSVGVPPGPVNQAPVLDSIGAKVVNEGSLLTFTVSATDPENDPLTYSAISAPVFAWPAGATFNNQVFSWTPDYDQSGTYNIDFVVFDGNLIDSEIVTITVNNVNQAPVLHFINDITVEEKDLVNINPSASDNDGDALTFTFTSPLDSNGEWQTEEGDEGIYQVTVTVSDGSLTDSQDITITVEEYEQTTVEVYKTPKFYIDKVIIYDPVYPGEDLDLVIGIERVGRGTVRDIELRVLIPSLGIEKEISEFDLRRDYIEKEVRISLPYNIERGTYTLKVIAENRYYDDLEYESFFVEGIDEGEDISIRVGESIVGSGVSEVAVNTVVNELLPTVTIGLLLVLIVIGAIVLVLRKL